MKSSWYLGALTLLFLIAQGAQAKPVVVESAPELVAHKVIYGPQLSWEWQLAKADYDAKKAAEEKARIEQEKKEAAAAARRAYENQYCRSASDWTPPDAGAIGKSMAEARGWVGQQWDELVALWGRESGWQGFVKRGDLWCVKFNYAGSGACGIPQALPCSKIPDPMSVESQLSWGMDYIARRYGDPIGAKNFFRANGWY